MSVKRIIDNIYEDRREEATKLARKESARTLYAIVVELEDLARNPPSDTTRNTDSIGMVRKPLPLGINLDKLRFRAMSQDYLVIDAFCDVVDEFFLGWPGGYAADSLTKAIAMAWAAIREFDFEYYLEQKLQRGHV